MTWEVERKEVRPPYTEEEMAEIYTATLECQEAHIDGYVICAAFKLVFLCGLRRKEILGLQIGHVLDNSGQVVDEIPEFSGQGEGRPPLQISEEAKEVIRDLIDYLDSNGYGTGSESPLFPCPNRGPYSPRKWNRHVRLVLGPFSNRFNFNVSTEKIRQSGICAYYCRLRDAGRWEDEALEETVAFARVTERQAVGILTGRIQPAGRPHGRLWGY